MAGVEGRRLADVTSPKSRVGAERIICERSVYVGQLNGEVGGKFRSDGGFYIRDDVFRHVHNVHTRVTMLQYNSHGGCGSRFDR